MITAMGRNCSSQASGRLIPAFSIQNQEPNPPFSRLKGIQLSGGNQYEENRRNSVGARAVPAGSPVCLRRGQSRSAQRRHRRLRGRRRAPVPVRQSRRHQRRACRRHRRHRRLPRPVPQPRRLRRDAGPLHDRPGEPRRDPCGQGRPRGLPGRRGHRLLRDQRRPHQADAGQPGRPGDGGGLRRQRAHRPAVRLGGGPGVPAGGPGRHPAVRGGDRPLRDLQRRRPPQQPAGGQLRAVPDRHRRPVPEERLQLHLRPHRFRRSGLCAHERRDLLPVPHRQRRAPEVL